MGRKSHLEACPFALAVHHDVAHLSFKRCALQPSSVRSYGDISWLVFMDPYSGWLIKLPEENWVASKQFQISLFLYDSYLSANRSC